MKRICQICELATHESGGLRTALLHLESFLATSGRFKSDILTNEKEPDDLFMEFRPRRFKFWKYSAELSRYLESHSNTYDIFHLHGVFMHSQYAGSRAALKRGIPYVMSCHGMLQPWYLKDKGLKKKFYLTMALKNMLRKASVLHAITPLEKESLYRLSGHKNIVEIPNLIHTETFPAVPDYAPEEDYFITLGRIHPGKGHDLLLKAFASAGGNYRLKIVGTENAYSHRLRQLAKSLGIADRVDFTGGLFGAEKYKLLANSRAFVLPSHSEAIGFVNLEAAMCATPVITTINTGINPQFASSGGILIDPKQEDLTGALQQTSEWTHQERTDRGRALRQYVSENYSWEKKGYLWNELYDSL